MDQHSLTTFPSLVERYYTQVSIGDQYVYVHQNGLCVIGLGPNHPALSKTVTSLNWDVGGVDRSQNQVRGKKKKGGIMLKRESPVVSLTCDDGTTYAIQSNVVGTLVETNERLNTQFSLLRDYAATQGYIAIISCSPPEEKRIRNLSTQETKIDIEEPPQEGSAQKRQAPLSHQPTAPAFKKLKTDS